MVESFRAIGAGEVPNIATTSDAVAKVLGRPAMDWRAFAKKRAKEIGKPFDEAIETFLDDKRPYMELKRRGEPDEVANVIAFLCSEAASFVNGSNYRVDSGSVATL